MVPSVVALRRGIGERRVALTSARFIAGVRFCQSWRRGLMVSSRARLAFVGAHHHPAFKPRSATATAVLCRSGGECGRNVEGRLSPKQLYERRAPTIFAPQRATASAAVSFAGGHVPPNTTTGQDTIDEVVSGNSSVEPSYVFLIQTQPGLEEPLLEELVALINATPLRSVITSAPVRDRPGLLQMCGPWSLLRGLLLRSRLANSVSVRVGDTFECRSLTQLAEGVRRGPWTSFLTTKEDLDILPVKVSICKETSPLSEDLGPVSPYGPRFNNFRGPVVAATVAVEQALRAAVWDSDSLDGDDDRGSLARLDIVSTPAPSPSRGVWSAHAAGLLVALRDDACSMELNCSGRLSVRPFVFASSSAGADEAYSVQPIKTPYLGDKIAVAPARTKQSWSLRSIAGVTDFASGDQRQSEKVAHTITRDWHGTRDLSATYAAAIAQHLPLRQLLTGKGSGADGGVEEDIVVWDPFCGNGGLLLEILSLVLGLPPAGRGHPFPCATLQPDIAQRFVVDAPHDPLVPVSCLARLTLLGTDLSAASILRARRFLHRFTVYYRDQIPSVASLNGHGARDASQPNAERRRPSSLLVGPTILDESGDENFSDAVPVAAAAPASEKRGRRRLMARPKEVGAASRGSDGMSKGKSKEGGSEEIADLVQNRGDVTSGVAGASSASMDRDQSPEVTREALESFSSSIDPEWGISLPCQLSLNVAAYHRVAPFVSGALIVTRMPREVHALGPTPRIANLYKQFSHFVASRSDWLGVYVFAEGPDFKRHSRMAWDVLLKFTDHEGRKCQLLRLKHAQVRPSQGFTKSSKRSLI